MLLKSGTVVDYGVGIGVGVDTVIILFVCKVWWEAIISDRMQNFLGTPRS